MNDAVRPGWYPWETAGRGEWRGTQSGPWLLCEPPPDGNCVATVSVRSAVVADGPERVKPAAPLPVSGNCAAAVWGSGRSLLSARPQGEDREASQPLRRRVSPKGRGCRKCRPVASRHVLDNDDAPMGRYSTPGMGFPGEAHRAPRWVGIPRLGWGFLMKRDRALRWVEFRLGRRERNLQRLSLGENRARSNAPSPSPNDRSDQLQSTDGCPAAGGISSEPLNGVQREKDLNTPAAGPDRGRRT